MQATVPNDQPVHLFSLIRAFIIHIQNHCWVGVEFNGPVNTINPGPAEPGYALPLQCRPSEANQPGSTLFVIKYVNLYQNPGSSNLIG